MPSTFNQTQIKQTVVAPSSWLRIRTIDMHTGGEPLRVILGGFPVLQGNSVLEYRRDIQQRFDHLRKSLMHEPRGHADMYGCLLLPPNDEGADFGILFLHNEGYSTMCGHAIIAITTLAIQMKWVPVIEGETKIVIDAPCGRITSFAKINAGQVQSVYFHGVPSFAVALDLTAQVPSLGAIQYDLSYGGAFYAYVDADRYGISMDRSNYRQLIEAGMAIKHAVMEQNDQILHPFESDLSFLYGTIFLGQSSTSGVDSKNVCIFAEGEVDRCPTGSGVSGRLPIHYQRGIIDKNTTLTIESITGSQFKGSIVREENYGPFKAIIPCVERTAFITGQHEFLIDPDDPFREGFFLR